MIFALGKPKFLFPVCFGERAGKVAFCLPFRLALSRNHSNIERLITMNTASIFKKMAAIVAIVGAGLLAAPLEQAQAQSGIPVVTEFCIFSNAASDYGLSRGYTGCLPLLDISGSSLEWIFGSVPVDISGFYTEDNVQDSGGVYGHFLYVPFGIDGPIYDGRYLLVSFYVSADPNSSSLSAWVTDSDGNWYSIDAWVSYDGWRGW